MGKRAAPFAPRLLQDLSPAGTPQEAHPPAELRCLRGVPFEARSLPHVSSKAKAASKRRLLSTQREKQSCTHAPTLAQGPLEASPPIRELRYTSRSEMPCPVISPSHWRVPPKRPSMQMDRPARRRQMLHRREHGRLVVQGRAVVGKTKTCAGCEDMSEKR